MLYISILIFLVMFFINTIFKIASFFRLGVPLLYALLVGVIFPDFVHEHEFLAMSILFALLILVVLSWVVTIRKRIRRKREQRQYDANI